MCYSLQEIDHIGYVRQAMEASSLGYFLDILESDTFKYSDVSNFLGYLSMTVSCCGHAYPSNSLGFLMYLFCTMPYFSIYLLSRVL